MFLSQHALVCLSLYEKEDKAKKCDLSLQFYAKKDTIYQILFYDSRDIYRLSSSLL